MNFSEVTATGRANSAATFRARNGLRYWADNALPAARSPAGKMDDGKDDDADGDSEVRSSEASRR